MFCSRKTAYCENSSFSTRFSFSVWTGLEHGMLNGLYFFSSHLTGDIYLHFLPQSTIIIIRSSFNCEKEYVGIFLHDNTTPHFRWVVEHELLKNAFPNRRNIIEGTLDLADLLSPRIEHLVILRGGVTTMKRYICI